MAPAPNVDEELALEAGSLTPQLLEWLVRLAAWMPFGQAVQLLEAITGVQGGKETAGGRQNKPERSCKRNKMPRPAD
jgi:hypothetical protein